MTNRTWDRSAQKFSWYVEIQTFYSAPRVEMWVCSLFTWAMLDSLSLFKCVLNSSVCGRIQVFKATRGKSLTLTRKGPSWMRMEAPFLSIISSRLLSNAYREEELKLVYFICIYVYAFSELCKPCVLVRLSFYGF